jgi:hypothetical protein
MKRITPLLLPTLFGLLFVATALFVLAYALGYQIDFKHRRIEKTGLAYLTSFPNGGFITVDGHYIKKKTPHKTQPLLPGKHAFKVQKDGFIPWNENAVIKPELVTLFEHILLFPITPKTSHLQPKGTVSGAHISEDGNHLIYTVAGGDEVGLWTAGLDLSAPKRILPLTTQAALPNPTQAALASYTDFTLISVSDDGASAIIHASGPNGLSGTVLVSLANPGASNILSDTYRDYSSFTYEAGQSSRLYAMKGSSLYRIDTGSSAAPTLVADDVIAYTSKPGTLSYVKSTASGIGLYSANTDGGSPSLLLGKLTDGQYQLSDDPSSSAVALLSTTDGQLRVVSRNGAGQIQVLIVGSNYSYIDWSRADSRLLYGGTTGAFVYDAPDVLTTQALSLALSPQNIDWMYDAYHIIYLSGGKIIVTEDDGQNSTTLAESGVLPDYSNSSKDLYLIKNDGSLQAQSTREPVGS